MSKKAPFKAPYIYDAGGDLSRRWRVIFSVSSSYKKGEVMTSRV